ncbi:hypothetical protein AUJ65_03330 [Candidatus Micrarchaeota archaeon CG1_02_51_15]|nr:MAG: hypothetical protein AUJ65_03330 [Candidatus Micrarchaeota archaeon CG1_02_51_15]
MKAACNSTPLIYLAKAGELQLLKKLFSTVPITPDVFEEVVSAGKAKGFADASLVEEATKQGWLTVRETGKQHFSAGQLDKSELSAINLALDTKAECLLIDEAPGRLAAKSLGLKCHGTVFIVLSALRKKIISAEHARLILRKIVSAGFRLKPELFAHAYEKTNQ